MGGSLTNWKYKLSRGQVFISLVGVSLMAIFGIFTTSLGGEALSGKMQDGHYFVRGGRTFHEVSHGKYVASALTCFGAACGVFLIVHTVLRQIKQTGLFEGKAKLAGALEVFFGAICGYVGICA